MTKGNGYKTDVWMEEEYRMVFELVGDALLLVDLESGAILDANSAAQSLFGYDLSELVGKSIVTLSAEPEKTRQAMMELPSTVGLRIYRRADGSEFPAEITIRRFPHHAENRVLACYRDISQHLRQQELLRERERSHSTLLSNLPGIAYRCKNDKDWTMEFISDGCLDLTGYPPEDLVNNSSLSYNNLITEVDRDRLWHEWQDVLATGRVFQGEYRIQTRDGKLKWVWEQGRGVYDDAGSVIALEGFITDISSRKAAEEAIAETIVSRDRLHSIIAHDLRSPFAGLLGFTEMLLEDQVHLTKEQIMPHLGNIHRLARHVYSLVENLLYWSRLQLDKVVVSPESINVQSLVEEVLTVLHSNAFKKSISTRSSIPPEVCITTDRNLLTIILMNLVSNAIKFTPHEGRVAVTATRTSLKELALRVSDTGVGIPASRLLRLFDPVEHSSTRGTDQEPGTGLGLLLCREMSHLLGGGITVESLPDRGTTFTVTLPNTYTGPRRS